MNIASKYGTFANQIRARLFPTEQAEAERWIEENIGLPEFEWDQETVSAGFLRVANDYVTQVNAFMGGAITAAMIEANGADLTRMAPLVATAERIGLAVRAFEDLLFAFQCKPSTSGLKDVYGGVIAGSLTSTFLGQMYNIFLHRNPLDIDKGTLLRMCAYCNRESTRMRYMAALQLAWMNDGDYRPSMADAINYAKDGPMGAGLRMSVALAAMSLGVSAPEQKRVEQLVDSLSVVVSVWSAILDVSRESSPHERGEDFRVGKVTPLTVLASNDRRLPIRKIWDLRTAFSSWTILENALSAATALIDDHTDAVVQQDRECPNGVTSIFPLWTRYLGEDARRLVGDIKSESLH